MILPLLRFPPVSIWLFPCLPNIYIFSALTLHSSDATERVTFSSTTAVPPKPGRVVLSYHSPDQSTGGPSNPEADVASIVDVTRLTASQRQALITSLNVSLNSDAPEAPPRATVQTSMAMSQLPTSQIQEDVPDLVDILDRQGEAGVSK